MKRLSMLTALCAAVMMVAANGLAYSLRPSQRIADPLATLDLEKVVPQSFGSWREETISIAQVVNPEQKAWLDRLYKQVLTRTYIDDKGRRIMLSIAYGGDQTESNEVHRPELCYPAQGFQIGKTEEGTLATPYGQIPVKRLSTKLGQRHEPVTYWVRVGGRVVRPGIDKKLEELKFGLNGRIPDGLIFRVSSIDRNETEAFAVQDNFIFQLISNLDVPERKYLTGLSSPSTAQLTSP